MNQPAPLNIPPPPPVDGAANRRTKWLILGLAGCGCLLFVGVILAAIAVPAFVSYIKRSKTAEASANVRALGVLVTSQCQAGDDLTFLQAGPLPAVPSSSRVLPQWQADPGFARLGFSPSEAVYYSYSVGSSPTEPGMIVIQARGDLDDDGVQSLFELSCDPRQCYCAPTPTVENELE